MLFVLQIATCHSREDVAPAAIAMEPFGCSGEGAKSFGHDAEELHLSLRPALLLRRQTEFASEFLHVEICAAPTRIAQPGEGYLRPCV